MENVVLIGMPSSGKSAAGKVLAKKLGYAFLDGDDVIRARQGKPLDEIISERGAEGFIEVEEAALCSIDTIRTVIATGGSAVYSEKAMAHLKSLGKLVYLKLDEAEIERRIPDFTARGVVMRGNISTLKELYAERVPLYEKYAEITVDTSGETVNDTVSKITSLL